MSVAEKLFAALPLEAAMPELRPKGAAPELDLLSEVADSGPLQLAALYLYVDDLDAAHRIVQNDPSPTSAWLHAIIHRREGDFSNSLYWYGEAANHSLLSSLRRSPRRFVTAAREGLEVSDLIELQREEWKLVYDYTVAEGL